MIYTPVVILGLGYTATELARAFDWPQESCVTSRRADATCDLPVVRFDWADENTWANLPEAAGSMIVTIPPVSREDFSEENGRLIRWCRWLHEHRAGVQRIVYISTTGVYPQGPGVWGELDADSAETESGEMRLMTESVISEYFDTRIVRAGGIYGPGRNLVTRALAGKSLARSDRPIHRIHVADLATICRAMLDDDDAPQIVNAVDQEAATSAAVLRWVAEQPWCEQAERVHEIAAELPEVSEAKDVRVIDNRCLMRWQPGGGLKYPSYREGLFDCFNRG